MSLVSKNLFFFCFFCFFLNFFNKNFRVFCDEDDAVKVLTEANFDSTIQANKLVLILFYAPWCGHCKRFEPEFKKAAEELKGKSEIVLAKVDAEAEKNLAQKFEIKAYPTIKFFRDSVPEEYTGGRTKSEVIGWLDKMTGEAVVTVEENEIDEYIKKTNTTSAIVVGWFKNKENEEYKNFLKVADLLRQFAKFVSVFSDKKEKAEIIIKKVDEDDILYKGNKTDVEELKLWVKDESFPLFGPVNGDNFKYYIERQHQITWMCGDEDQYKQYKKSIQQAAFQLKANYSFVWLDTKLFKTHAEGALGVTSFPALVYQSKKGRFLLPNAETALSSPEVIVKFTRDVEEGKVERSLKSEDIPEVNDKAVKVVVGKTFVEMVLQDKKDVMLEVYAPWCGHCKQFEPEYEKLAEKMKPFEDKLLIAKLDGTANESPVDDFDWTGFPTIFFVKAGEKRPIRYEGSRDVENIIEFIKKNSAFSYDKPAGKEEL